MKTSLQGLKTGPLGEDLAARFLVKRGYGVISRNFSRSWGEIDIIASKDGILSFVEVKAVTCEIPDSTQETISRVTSRHVPEDRVDKAKIQKLHRAIQTYLGKQGKEGSEWELSVAAVFIDPNRRRSLVRFMESVSL